MLDTADIAEVPEDQQLDHDEMGQQSGSNALEGGADDDLADVYADPGLVLAEDLG